MRSFIFSSFVLIFALLAGCDKSMVNDSAGNTITATTKTGSWMTTYMENNVAVDIGNVMITFDGTGGLVADKDGTKHAGTYTESKTASTHTFTLRITTNDPALLKVNRKWKVTGVTEYLIDCKDDDTSSNATINFMKH